MGRVVDAERAFPLSFLPPFSMLSSNSLLSNNNKSYGTTMSSLPFAPDLAFHALKESQLWWFDHEADGRKGYPDASASQGWAPDGMLCDNGSPKDCK